MKCRRNEPIAALVALLLTCAAEAGVRRFDLTTDASSNAEGEIELEGWLDFGRPQLAPSRATNGMAWLGARFGLLDSLELAGFLVLEKSDTGGTMGQEPAGDDTSGLMLWVSELRWRPAAVGKWPVDAFIQFQLMHWFEALHPTQFRFTLGLSKALGRFLLAGNFSYWDAIPFRNPAGAEVNWRWLDLSGGVSVNLFEADGSVPSVSVGLEAWSLINVGNFIHNHLLMGGGLVVGPTLALARGRLWLTGHLGIPVLTMDSTKTFSTQVAPVVGRIMLGINL